MKFALWLYEHDHFKADKETYISYFGDIKQEDGQRKAQEN